MIISHDNKPKFKLQTAYDTLTSRLRGLGYDVDGNIELDTSGYGHGWIKVLRNGRKNNFIYMCSHHLFQSSLYFLAISEIFAPILNFFKDTFATSSHSSAALAAK